MLTVALLSRRIHPSDSLPALACCPLPSTSFSAMQQGKVVEELLDQVSDRQRVFQPYSDLFALVSGQSFTAPALRRLVDDLTADGLRADESMQRLSRIMQFGDLRRSMIFPGATGVPAVELSYPLAAGGLAAAGQGATPGLARGARDPGSLHGAGNTLAYRSP